MTVSCLQKHEVLLVWLEVEGYLSHGIELRPGDTVFDVGANIGLFSLAAYHRCERNLSIYAFEPVASIFEVLRANIKRNTANGQVQALPFGLSNNAETIAFTYYPRAPVLSTAYPDEEADLRMVENVVLNNIMHLDDAPLPVRALRWLPEALRVPLVRCSLRLALRTKTVTCQMRTLSQFVAERNIERIDLLKIDVEKAELDVLLGIEDEDWAKVQRLRSAPADWIRTGFQQARWGPYPMMPIAAFTGLYQVSKIITHLTAVSCPLARSGWRRGVGHHKAPAPWTQRGRRGG
jgi:FkbM family methyltransferase